MIATVSTGKRRVGMSSLSGSKPVLAHGAGARLGEGLLGVVAGAHERAGSDGLEAERVGLALELGELLGMPVAHDRQVVAGRAQILPDGEHLHVMLAQDPERLQQLLARLAEPGHQAGLRDDLVAAHLLGVAQDSAGAQEARTAPRQRIQPRHRLDVVVEHVRALRDHPCERHLLAAEVRRQHLDLAARRHPPDRADHADEGAGAEVGQVVAVHACDHGMPQPHLAHRLGHAQRLERIMVSRLAGLDVAEPAAARAGVAEDHERGGAAFPAIADVRAGRLLANRVQPFALDHPAQLTVARASRRRPLEPLRLAIAERTHGAHLEYPRAARIRARAGAHAATASRRSSRSIDTSRCRASNAPAKRYASRLRKHGSDGERPVSRATEVTCTRSIPQGTIHSNGSRPLSTFTASPCIETPSRTRTPIEAILASPAQTPVSGVARGSATTPSSASAETIAPSIVCTKSATRSTAMIG